MSYQVLIVTGVCEIKIVHYTEDCVLFVVANEKKEPPFRVRTTLCNTVSLVMKNKRTGISNKLMMIVENKVISENKA
jgi:hypothetical protein